MRVLVAACLAAIAPIIISGCGSSFKGSIDEGGGGTPRPAAGQPVVTGVNPASVAAGGASFKITATGTNFAQGDTVQWDNVPLTSTFVSATEMTAIVPSQLINVSFTPTTVSIIVQTPVPYSLNFGTTISITPPPDPGTAGFTLSTVNVQANDVVWDSASQSLYLSVAASDPDHPNTISALNPATGHFSASVSAGSGANLLATSTDGSWLYAGMDADGAIERFAVPTLASDITIPLGSGSANHAIAMAPAPNSPNTIAVSQGASLSQPGSVVVYDGATPRASTVTSVSGEPEPLWSVCWTSSTDLYGAFSLGFSNPMAVLSANSTGVQLVRTTSAVTMGNIVCSSLTGNVYGNYGQIYDPSSDSFDTRLPANVLGGGVASGQQTPLAIDDALGMAWIVEHTVNSPANQMTIAAFDLKTNALLGSIAIPNVTGSPVKLIRWGANGLAFLTQEYNGPQPGNGLYIVSGAFVTTPSVQSVKTSRIAN